MRNRHDKIVEAGQRLDGLRLAGLRPPAPGAAEPGPDPRFRALLRERLVTAAGRPGPGISTGTGAGTGVHAADRARDRLSDTDRNEARDDGRNARSD
ncbi:hypothetical protein [Actinomadura sp. NTSP31]|uniref:hypothetical protein n=1 Tax=Actinomadura sp. NTSP31 TaxID=1735447 RepID=UPI0035C26339